MSAPRFRRYVALGDSSTEGLMDEDGQGGWRGWSRRLAGMIAASQGGLEYVNLAVRGRTTRAIREQQLERALALAPDLASVFSGTNDILGRRFDRDAFAGDVLALQRSLRAAGATVITFTLPDLAPLVPLARFLAPRVRAMNDAVRAACAETGTLLVDLAQVPFATDRRLWHDDRLHANAEGHARIAAALAESLGIEGSDGAWRAPLPAEPSSGPIARARGEARWMARHLLPWCWQALRGS